MLQTFFQVMRATFFWICLVIKLYQVFQIFLNNLSWSCEAKFCIKWFIICWASAIIPNSFHARVTVGKHCFLALLTIFVRLYHRKCNSSGKIDWESDRALAEQWYWNKGWKGRAIRSPFRDSKCYTHSCLCLHEMCWKGLDSCLTQVSME